MHRISRVYVFSILAIGLIAITSVYDFPFFEQNAFGQSSGVSIGGNGGGAHHSGTGPSSAGSGTISGVIGGGSGCSDCTPSTMGLNKSGYMRLVEEGFRINGVGIDVDHFFQNIPVPFIVNTGDPTLIET